MRRIFLLLFLVASVTELVAQLYSARELHHYVKPMLMIFLGLYYFFSVTTEGRSVVVLLAILFSFLGDSFLLYDSKEPYFMLGLGSFLLAHVFYIFSFRQSRAEASDDQLQTVRKARMAFPVILAATGLVIVLYPHLGALRLPVVVYAGVLMFMVLNALFRYEKASSRSFWMVSAGAILFMISDSILAINKFLEPVSNAGFAIMLTYLSAQYLIVEGLIKHDQHGT
jgi:uncharacterized membrane protein YhhN